MPASNYLRGKLYDHVLRNVAYVPPATIYLALYSADPTVADVGTELAGSGYARVAVTMGAGTNGIGSNSAQALFATATGLWTTATHWGLRDAIAAGNLLEFGPLAAPKTVQNGETPRVKIGDLVASFG